MSDSPKPFPSPGITLDPPIRTTGPAVRPPFTRGRVTTRQVVETTTTHRLELRPGELRELLALAGHEVPPMTTYAVDSPHDLPVEVDDHSPLVVTWTTWERSEG